MKKRSLSVATAAALLAGSLAGAAPPEPALTGDWLGARPWLASRGLTFSGSDLFEVLGNVSGGRRTGAAFNGLLQLGGDLDLEKLVGWRGATVHGMVYYPQGASLSAKYVGDFADVSNIDAYDSLRLYEAWLEQTAFDGRFSLRIGFMAADSEFCVTDAADPFINSAFGAATAETGNFPMSTYPYSGLGVRLRLGLAGGWSVQLAAFDGNVAPGVFPDPTPGAAPSNEFNKFGTHFALRSDEGAMLFGEVGWRRPDLGATSGPAPLSGAVKAGAVYHTDRFAEIRGSTLAQLGPPPPAEGRSVRGDYAGYAIAEHELWREPGTKGDGVTAFARVVFAPPGRNFFSHSAEAGLVYRGVLQSDAGDSLALGVAWLGLSREVRSAYRGAGRLEPRDEVILELTYQFAATPWATLQPDLQWIIDPGGASRDALVVGVRSTLRF